MDDTKSILIIDDEGMIHATLDAFLEDDYYCFSAESGEHGLSILSQRKMDIAIVDMRLPGINGNKFVLAANHLIPDMKFIIHTALPGYELPDELIEIGMSEKNIFYKPIKNMEILKNKIDELLEEDD